MHAMRLAILAAALFGLAWNGPATADPVTVRIAWAQMPGHMIPVLFAHKQILKHYGVSYTVEPILFRGSTPQIMAMASNGIDMGVFSPSALALAVTNAHLDLKITADIFEDGVQGYHSEEFMVRSDSGINSVADLKGKRIGVNAIGSTLDIAMRIVTRKQGLQDRRDFSVLETAFPAMPAMLSEGKIDIGPIVEPWASSYLKSGKFKVLFTLRDAVGPTQGVFLAARSDFLAAHHDQMLDFYEDYVRAFRWFTDPKNRQEAIRIIADFMKQPESNFTYLFTADDAYRDPYMVPKVAYVQNAIDAAVSAGALPKPFTVTPSMVDLSFVSAAKARIEAAPN